MSADDRRLAALIATIAADSGRELAALLGGPSGDAVASAVVSLSGASRASRLAELARALAPAGRVGAAERGAADGVEAAAPAPLRRLRERLRAELLR